MCSFGSDFPFTGQRITRGSSLFACRVLGGCEYKSDSVGTATASRVSLPTAPNHRDAPHSFPPRPACGRPFRLFLSFGTPESSLSVSVSRSCPDHHLQFVFQPVPPHVWPAQTLGRVVHPTPSVCATAGHSSTQLLPVQRRLAPPVTSKLPKPMLNSFAPRS